MNSYIKSVDVCLSILISINRFLDVKRVDIENLVKACPSVIHVMSNVVPVVIQMVNEQLKIELNKIGYPPAPTEIEVIKNVEKEVTDEGSESSSKNEDKQMTAPAPVVVYPEPTIIAFLDLCDIYCATSLKLKDQVRIFEKKFLPLNKDIAKCEIKGIN